MYSDTSHVWEGSYADSKAVLAYEAANWTALADEDAAACAVGTLLGRIIRQPMGDGQAVYQIIKLNKRTARIRACDGLGDDWVLPVWGVETSIPLVQAARFVENQDALRALFSNTAR